jgi:hypothetical protein
MAISAPSFAETSVGSPLWLSATREEATHRAVSDLQRARFIIPLQRKLATAGLSSFLPPAKRIAIQALQSLPGMRSRERNGWLQETSLLRDIKQAAGDAVVGSIARIGTPGPYSKNTVLFLNIEGEPVAVAKVGTSVASGELLANEAQWLSRLAATPLSANVPRLIWTEHRAGAHILVQSAVSGDWGGHLLGQTQLRFLSQLQSVSETYRGYRGSPMESALNKTFSTLHNKLSPAWTLRAKLGLKILEEKLRAPRLPMVVAHRDFAGWNTRQSGNTVFVFDWEYAREGYVPLYDLFHYLLMPAAVRKYVTSSQALNVVADVVGYGRRLVWGNEKIANAELQLLAYLLDVCLFYLESNNGNDTDDIVVYRFGELIDRFGEWSKA